MEGKGKHKKTREKSDKLAIGDIKEIGGTKDPNRIRQPIRSTNNNNKMEGKGKHKKTREKSDKLAIGDIKEIGGTKEDLQLLSTLDSDGDSDFENPAEDFDAEPVKRDEIRQLLKDLDIAKYRPDDGSKPDKKEKKRKLLEMPMADVDDADTHPEPTTPDPASQEHMPGTRKKRERNKYKVQHDEVSSTTRDPHADLTAHMAAYQPRKYLLVKAGGKYLDDQDTKPEPAPVTMDLSEDMTRQMERFAAKLLQDEISMYNKKKENVKRSDVGWMRTVLTSGTLADKMAALTVLVQESAVHNIAHLDTLVSMAKKKGKRECLQATDTLKELFLTDLLPDYRKLKTFTQHPLSAVGSVCGWNKDSMDRRLILWYWESQLKEKYATFVSALDFMVHDTLLAVKQKSVNAVYQLLVRKPEQEKPLLMLLINKVGDPHYKLASTVSHLLSRLVESHPNMKAIVVREMEQLLFRPNLPIKAQYYSVCFLNRIALQRSEAKLAAKLISIYFSFFKAFVKKGEVDSKMMSALLSGVNRAYPYAKLSEDSLSAQLEHLYRIVHIVNFNTSLQALMLLFQVMDASKNISERYFTALYRKLSDPALKTSSKQTMFLNLLFKSMRKDDSERRVKAFIKRLLQVCSYQQPQFSCGALVLLSEVLKTKPGLLTVSHMEEESDGEENFVDLPAPDSDTEGANMPLPTHQAGPKVRPSWDHRRNLNEKSGRSGYDPYHRNPQYCHAERECIWELERLGRHFHPSVSLFAKQILRGEVITYNGDPLHDFTLIRFLDRFVYKNPKKQEQMVEKVATLPYQKHVPSGIKGIPVNTERFLKLDERKVPVDDIFYHKYFTQKAALAQKADGDDDADSEVGSISDTEFDDFLDKYEEQFDDGDMADLDMDFSREFGKKKGKPGRGDDDSDDDLDDIDDDLSDEEVDFGQDEDFAAAFNDEVEDDDEDGDMAGPAGLNEEDIHFSDDDELSGLAPKGKGPKRKSKPSDDLGPVAKKGKSSGPGLFAAAEEFAHMMDENVGAKFDMIGSDAMSNKDKADVKQLKWEMERDQWIKGTSWKDRKGKKSGASKGQKPGASKRPGGKPKFGGKTQHKPGKHGKKK